MDFPKRRYTMGLSLAVLALVISSGCLSPHGWQRIHDFVGINDCQGPTGPNFPIPLTRFKVRHDRMFANVTLQMDAGLVEFQLLDPSGSVERSREYSRSGTDSFEIENPDAGVWEGRLVCETGFRFHLEWRITVDAYSKP